MICITCAAQVMHMYQQNNENVSFYYKTLIRSSKNNPKANFISQRSNVQRWKHMFSIKSLPSCKIICLIYTYKIDLYHEILKLLP